MNQKNILEHMQTLEKRISVLTSICKSQADMIQSFMGSDLANLDNFTGNLDVRLSEEDSEMANIKIKRRVTIDGRQVWITANSEQEYAEKLFQAVKPQVSAAGIAQGSITLSSTRAHGLRFFPVRTSKPPRQRPMSVS